MEKAPTKRKTSYDEDRRGSPSIAKVIKSPINGLRIEKFDYDLFDVMFGDYQIGTGEDNGCGGVRVFLDGRYAKRLGQATIDVVVVWLRSLGYTTFVDGKPTEPKAFKSKLIEPVKKAKPKEQPKPKSSNRFANLLFEDEDG